MYHIPPILAELCNSLSDDIINITKLLLNYNSDDWTEVVKDVKKSDSNCNNYHKIRIHNNDLIDVYLIVWFDDSESPIHDHSEGGCIVKILKGTLTEQIFQNIGNNHATLIKSNILKQHDINYKSGNQILHKIKADEYSVSVHIYFPPNHKQKIYTNENTI